MIIGILSLFLDNNTAGVGHINLSSIEKKDLAQQSIIYNQQHLSKILSIINK